MAFRYVVKKRMVGIGTKTEKYVAASYSVANIDFDRLCDQVTSQGMVPRGIVKAVLDGMIDALCTYASIGATVRLGDFGSLRPGLNGKSQEDAKSVTADVVYRKRLLNYILCIRFFIEVHSIVSASRFFHMPTYLRVVIECQSRFFPFFPAFSRNCPDYFLHTSGSSSFRSLSDLGAR